MGRHWGLCVGTSTHTGAWGSTCPGLVGSRRAPSGQKLQTEPGHRWREFRVWLQGQCPRASLQEGPGQGHPQVGRGERLFSKREPSLSQAASGTPRMGKG